MDSIILEIIHFFPPTDDSLGRRSAKRNLHLFGNYVVQHVEKLSALAMPVPNVSVAKSLLSSTVNWGGGSEGAGGVRGS